jgi:hypothetical protein
VETTKNNCSFISLALSARQSVAGKAAHPCFQRIGKKEGKCHSSFMRVAGLRFLSMQYFEPSNPEGIGKRLDLSFCKVT